LRKCFAAIVGLCKTPANCLNNDVKTRSSKLGLSIIAGGLSFVGSANAMDLILNGSFENFGGSEWKYFNTYNYSPAYSFFTGPPVPASENPGTIWSWQHASAFGAWANFVTPTNEADHLQFNLIYANCQTVNLTNALSSTDIDAGLGQFTFSSWLASYGVGLNAPNPEQPYLVLRFFDDTATNQIGGNVIFDRTTNNFAVTYATGNTNIPSDLRLDHSWIKYIAGGPVPIGARKAKVYITRSPNAGRSGTPDTYVDLVKLNVININVTTALESAVPADGTPNNGPAAAVVVTLRDIATQVNTNSIKLRFDDNLVTPTMQKSGTLTTIQYSPPSVLAPLSSHTYSVAWDDNGVPVASKSNQFQFAVAPYVNLTTGPPIYLETFDGVAEGSLPAGWSVTNATDIDVPGTDLNDFHSDSYRDWVVISRSTLSNLWNVPGGADYISVIDVAPNQVVNDALVTDLVSNNFILAASSSRSGNQVQTMFTGDYDLTGNTNVYLIFNALYTQNQDSIGAIEYSINGGATWLPALYLLDGPDVLRDSQGNIDASNTLAFDYSGNAAQTPPPPGNFGAFIGVDRSQWASLGPFLSARIDDDLTSSKRVEVVRLAQADNQPAVRFRIAQAGNNSWYFGIDQFGIYSLSNIAPPIIITSPVSETIAVGNAGAFNVGTPMGVGPISFQWRRDGVNLDGKTSSILALANVQLADAGNYDVVVTNPGGSVTSSPPALLTVINPIALITGQWDFDAGNLAATIGRDLEYYDDSVQTNTFFGTTTSFGIAGIAGQPVSVMKFTPTSGNSQRPGSNPGTNAWGGYKMFHGAVPTGGGTNINQYTLIFDVLYPGASDHSWRAIIQASTNVFTGGDDSEFYVSPADGIGITSIYDGNIAPGVWHRIALAVDMAGPGLHPVVEKFVDGAKFGEQTAGLDTLDGRFSLNPLLALLFAEDNGYNNDAYVSSVQFRSGRLSDAAIAAMGGPSADKIPAPIGKVFVYQQGGNIFIQWRGNTLLSADDITGPWTPVIGATKPYQVPTPLDEKKFYRAE
jgi:hypothetical protein